jgi:predicted metal-binding membrane protein
MWTVMMVGMMTPSATPMVLTYSMVARQAQSRGTPFAAAAWFVCGYLLAWSLFALFATTGQWELERLALLTPMMASASTRFGGALLVAVGIYQWTQLKNVCLAHCRAPLSFVQSHGGFKPNAGGSVRLGLLHGAYCIGCCWALMALLFVGGVMNVLWIVALTLLVLAEKLLPYGRVVARTAGLGAFAVGIWTLVGL